MRAYFIMLTNDKMAVAATLEILFTESFNLVLKSLKSRKIAINVDYDSSEDTKETRRVDGYFRSLSARSPPIYVAVSLYPYISKIVPILLRKMRGLVFWSEKENISVLMCDLPN